MMIMVYYINYASIELVDSICLIIICKSSYNEGVKQQVTDVQSNTCNTYSIILYHGAR